MYLFYLVNRFGNVTFTENQYYLNLNGPTTDDVNMISMADVMMNWRKNPKLLNKESNDSFKLEHFYAGLFNILLSTWCESVALQGNGNNDKRHQNSSGLIRYISFTKFLKNKFFVVVLFTIIDFTKKFCFHQFIYFTNSGNCRETDGCISN